jgi:hypothetical protein
MPANAMVDTSPSLSPPTVGAVYAAACAAAYGSPVIENSYRGLVAEIIVTTALAPDWHLCSAGWSGWDLQHVSGCRLEVKQSAARQTWAAPKKPPTPGFGIPEKTGYYENGVTWTAQTGRHAHIYVFAYHPLVDETTDHRKASKWQFNVVPTSQLPSAKSISLVKLRSRSETVLWGGLKIAVEQARATL